MSIFLLLVSTGLSIAVVYAPGWIPAHLDATSKASILLALFLIPMGPMFVLHLTALFFAGVALIKGDGRLLGVLGLVPNALFFPALFAVAKLLEYVSPLPVAPG